MASAFIQQSPCLLACFIGHLVAHAMRGVELVELKRKQWRVIETYVYVFVLLRFATAFSACHSRQSPFEWFGVDCHLFFLLFLEKRAKFSVQGVAKNCLEHGRCITLRTLKFTTMSDGLVWFLNFSMNLYRLPGEIHRLPPTLTCTWISGPTIQSMQQAICIMAEPGQLSPHQIHTEGSTAKSQHLL